MYIYIYTYINILLYASIACIWCALDSSLARPHPTACNTLYIYTPLLDMWGLSTARSGQTGCVSSRSDRKLGRTYLGTGRVISAWVSECAMCVWCACFVVEHRGAKIFKKTALLCAPCVHQRVHSVRTAHCQHMLFHKLMSTQSEKQIYNNTYLVTFVSTFVEQINQ